MAFGIIAIQTESGEYQEYELDKPTASIGRLPGNDIVLNTSSVSRYHARIDVAEGQVFLVDLGTVNGTFLNDHQIEPNSRIPLSDGDVITVGDVQLTFMTPTRRTLSIREAARLKPTAEPVEVAGMPFRLILDRPGQSIAPGARLKLSLIIENMGLETAIYTINVGGMDPGWIKVNWHELEIDPGNQAEAQISIRPPRDSQTRPGLYPLTVRVALKDDPKKVIEAVREVDVVAYRGLGMAAVEGKQPGVYHVAVQNQGNTPIDVRMDGYSRQRLLRYHFEPARVHLAPGQTAQLLLTVRPNRGVSLNRSQPIRFAIVAHGLDAAGYQAPLATTYTPHRSWLPWLGVPILMALMLTALVIVGGLLYLGGFLNPLLGALALATPSADMTIPQAIPPTSTLIPPSAPPTLTATSAWMEIRDFTSSGGSLVYGLADTPTEVVFSWRVEGLPGPAVLIGDEGRLRQDLSAEQLAAGTFSLPLDVLIWAVGWGDHVFKLVPSNSDSSQSIRLSVEAIVCKLSDRRIYEQPDAQAEPVEVLPDLNRAMILGRSPDGEWLYLGNYNHAAWSPLTPLGWMVADDYERLCAPALSLDRLIVVEPDRLPTGQIGSGGAGSAALTPTSTP